MLLFYVLEYRDKAPGLDRGLKPRAESEFSSRLLSNQNQIMKMTDLYSASNLYNFESSSDEDEPRPALISTQHKPSVESETAAEDAEVIEELTKVCFCGIYMQVHVCIGFAPPYVTRHQYTSFFSFYAQHFTRVKFLSCRMRR